MFTKVLVFGTFDGLHAGHLYFLSQARKLGNTLIVVVARESMVKKLKHKKPRHNEKERLALVASLKVVDRAVIGDKKISSYAVVRRLRPSIICLGYDQRALVADLRACLPGIGIVIARGYKKHQFHTSKL